MFNIDGDNISLSVGDTATLRIRADGDLVLNPDVDRVLFTIKNAAGDIVLQRTLAPDVEGSVLVAFSNADTDFLSAGSYSYDVRYVINPNYDDDGNVIDGDRVITPKRPQTFTLLSVVGDV